MCRIMEELNAKVAAKAKEDFTRQYVFNMLRKNKLTLEDIAEYSNLTIDEVKKLDKELRETEVQD